MSLLEEMDISEKIPKELKNNIKYYHVFSIEDYSGQTKHSLLFVTNEDKVYAMGDNSSGKLGSGQTSTVNSPVEVIELSGKGIKEFFIGTDYALGLSSDGNLYSWGFYTNGHMGREACIKTSVYRQNRAHYKPGPIKVFGEIDIKIKQVCCGDTYVLVLLENGIVLVWGYIYDGTMNGQDKKRSIQTPEELTSVNTDNWRTTIIVSNGSRFFALKNDNKVYSWGFNDTRYLGHEITDTRINLPTLISNLSRVRIIDIKLIDIAAYFLSADGKVYVCGHFIEYGHRAPKYPILIESDQKFTRMERIDNKTVVAINDKQIVYDLKRRQLIETEFKSIEEYSVRKLGITYKTFKADFAPLMASPDKSLSTSIEALSPSDDEFLCKICFESKVQSVVIPCGHTLCNTCSQTLTTEMCHFCRSPITTVIKLRF